MTINTLYNAKNKPANRHFMLLVSLLGIPPRGKFIIGEKRRAPTQWICWTFLSISRNNDEGH
jgi:hypothetical protein